MDLNIIPAVGLLIVVLFSLPEKGQDKSSTHRKYSRSTYVKQNNRLNSRAAYFRDRRQTKKHNNKVNVQTVAKNTDLDYESILTYITSTYKKIKKEDAELIAQSLVEYGKKHELDPKFTAALIARESAFNNTAVSSTGAKGLGQIKDFNYKSLKISDPFDIKQNAQGTTKYIKRMLKIWKGKSDDIQLALASYYKGHGAVKKDNGKLDNTTKSYVKDIMNNYKKILSIREKKESAKWR